MKCNTQYSMGHVACSVWHVGCCILHSTFYLSCFVGALALLWGCTSVRPVIKIGVLAPFEGLYRRTGYDVLAAVRLATHEVGAGQADLLPLALDDANDPVRAAQKLLQDPDLRAVIGPLAWEPLVKVTSVLDRPSLRWFSPLALDKTGFLWPANQRQALTELSAAIAETAKRQGAQRLVLAGEPLVATWSWSGLLALPVVVGNDPSAIGTDDAVFWLGDAATAADFLTRMRAVQPQTPFWLGAQAQDPVFLERTSVRTNVFWAAWVDSGYDPWQQTHQPTTVFAYQAYAATQQAIYQIIGHTPTNPAVWQIRLFVLLPDGQSRPLGQK